MDTQHILAADIGGTSSRFAHFVLEKGRRESLKLERVVWLKTKSVSSFSELIDQLRKSDLGLPIESAEIAVFAVAGPVEGGLYCSPPLIEWDVDLRNARADFGLKNVRLINDFVAQAYSCRSPLTREAQPVIRGTDLRVDESSAVGVIGAGTGLGKAMLTRLENGTYLALPSEGGHAAFAPENERELDFSRFVCSRTGGRYATWDDVVSGKGLVHLHAFLTKQELDPAAVAATFGSSSETLVWFSSFYGRACRDTALGAVALGGVYIAGGVAAKNPVIVTHPVFQEVFRDSHAHRELLKKISVWLVTNEESGLWGAALYGAQNLG